MTCPTQRELTLFELGELSVNESQAIERHRATCGACRRALQEQALLLHDLRAVPALASSEDAFVACVLERRRQSPGRSVTDSRRLAAPRAWLAPLVAAAALCLFAPRLSRPEPTASSGPVSAHEQLRARGTRVATHAREQPFAELLRVRDGVFAPLSGQDLRPGDAISVRCNNRGEESTHLMVFALDTQDTVHWLFPAYLDPATNPRSITIAARTRDRLLDEMVEPDAPAPGALRVFAVFSGAALSVAQIEAHRHELARSTLPAFLESARVQRWSATWNER